LSFTVRVTVKSVGAVTVQLCDGLLTSAVAPSPKVHAWAATVPGATSVLVLVKLQVAGSQLWVKLAVGGVLAGSKEAMVTARIFVAQALGIMDHQADIERPGRGVGVRCKSPAQDAEADGCDARDVAPR
jgi:hypothetical protein